MAAQINKTALLSGPLRTYGGLKKMLLGMDAVTYIWQNIWLREKTTDSLRLNRSIQGTRTGLEPEPILPQGHHLLGFFPVRRSEHLFPDGTDRDQTPGPLFSRRLWVGGSINFRSHWREQFSRKEHELVTKFNCQQTITDVRFSGNPNPDQFISHAAHGIGDKVFVDYHRRYISMDRDAPAGIVEKRSICFLRPKTADEIKRDLEGPTKSLTSPYELPARFEWSTLTATELFRFSAITMNAHKIHLDRQYCREVEGYPDLLVHGPLLLLLMFSALTKYGYVVENLTYRNIAPVFVGEKFRVCLGEATEQLTCNVWIEGADNTLRVKGSATLESMPVDFAAELGLREPRSRSNGGLSPRSSANEESSNPFTPTLAEKVAPGDDNGSASIVARRQALRGPRHLPPVRNAEKKQEPATARGSDVRAQRDDLVQEQAPPSTQATTTSNSSSSNTPTPADSPGRTKLATQFKSWLSGK